MNTTNEVAKTALLVGEPARAAMLLALMDGRALTATELARCAAITPQTASAHLSRLVGAQLLRVAKQGKHRYHTLASPEVARMLEGIMQISSRDRAAQRTVVTGPRDKAMRTARTCYDHFAGKLGVAITDSLLDRGAIEFVEDSGLVTDSGVALLREAGIVVDGGETLSKAARRPPCRPCLDWSERRPHVAGKLGSAICQHFLAQHYVQRIDNARALRITPTGKRALFEIFGLADFA